MHMALTLITSGNVFLIREGDFLCVAIARRSPISFVIPNCFWNLNRILRIHSWVDVLKAVWSVVDEAKWVRRRIIGTWARDVAIFVCRVDTFFEERRVQNSTRTANDDEHHYQSQKHVNRHVGLEYGMLLTKTNWFRSRGISRQGLGFVIEEITFKDIVWCLSKETLFVTHLLLLNFHESNLSKSLGLMSHYWLSNARNIFGVEYLTRVTCPSSFNWNAKNLKHKLHWSQWLDVFRAIA